MPGFNEALIEDVRANGRVTSGPFAGRNVLLLTTTGAKSGQHRTNPLVFSRDGDRVVIVASKGGAPTNPDWFHNLRTHPIVAVELGGERFRARAHVVPEPDRTRLYRQHATENPGFWDYEKRTTRRIPVVTLERLD